ncbi:hypothetical protein T492DRAFT_1007807 [Pavlovales sp. CCMP2436]|nr:hypothetical protein T492DRAFT_1007807 [Pavlovales sp. CCMP2436]
MASGGGHLGGGAGSGRHRDGSEAEWAEEEGAHPAKRARLTGPPPGPASRVAAAACALDFALASELQAAGDAEDAQLHADHVFALELEAADADEGGADGAVAAAAVTRRAQRRACSLEGAAAAARVTRTEAQEEFKDERLAAAREAQAAQDADLARALQADEEEAAREEAASPSPQPGPQGSPRCGLPGCIRRAERHGFCSELHFARARSLSILAPPSDDIERAFCAPSGTYACLLLTRKSSDRQPLCDQFLQAWRKPGPQPRIERVYRVVADNRIRDRFEAYAAKVGNERRRFHETSLRCNFGIDLGAAPCADPGCRICSIMQGGFRLEHAGSGPLSANRANRYGNGLYFSATSGKSNDYAYGSERVRGNRNWRCLLVASVAAGRAFRTEEVSLALDGEPPDGHDSVVGEV